MRCCKWDNWVEPHQNPSYESINQGPAKWALATCELMCAMRVVNVEAELGWLRKPLSQSPEELKVFLENNWRMHWGRTSLQKSIFTRVTLSRNCLKPNSSVGALNGASYQLLGADTHQQNMLMLQRPERAGSNRSAGSKTAPSGAV